MKDRPHTQRYKSRTVTRRSDECAQVAADRCTYELQRAEVVRHMAACRVAMRLAVRNCVAMWRQELPTSVPGAPPSPAARAAHAQATQCTLNFGTAVNALNDIDRAWQVYVQGVPRR